MPATDVLICGAGPTGLVLALRLARAGVRLRIVDAAAEPGTTSRALVVHARTLELYRQMGLADGLLAEGLPFRAANLWVRGRQVAHVEIGDFGRGVSPFPYLVVCTQDRHERFLIDALRRLGIEVERPIRLVALEAVPDRVRVRLALPSGVEEACEATYLAGCDGSHSKVRELVGVDFPGGTYSRVFYVADVEATGPVLNDQLHVALDEADLVAVFPLRGGSTCRLIGTVHADQADKSLGWDDVDRRAPDRLGIRVERVNWFSTYRVHHRVANRFRVGRIFLAGDAAHVHSPVGGQGMNTGIGDAVNLSWKLADVVQGRAKPELLDSYEPERIAFARRLVATTDRAFTIATSTGRLAQLVRTRIVPRVLPPLFRTESMRRFLFRTLSQTAIHYRGSPLSEGRVGTLHGGDRLPWVEVDGSDNHAVLDGLGWQVHVYGAADAGLAEACASRGYALHVFAWRQALAAAGLTEDALYVVRPDGYLAQVSQGQSALSRSNV